MVSGEEYNHSFRFVYFVSSRIVFSLPQLNPEGPSLVGSAQMFSRSTHRHIPYANPVSLRNPKTCPTVITGEAQNMEWRDVSYITHTCFF